VYLYVDTSVSEEHTASVFRAEGGDSIFLRNVPTYKSTRRHNPEDDKRGRIRNEKNREDLKINPLEGKLTNY
jgi:hypothetical protein